MIPSPIMPEDENTHLRQENARLREGQARMAGYLRAKIDQLLVTIGTCPLHPDELDEETLLSLDPIGIINGTFIQILEHLQQTNQRLTLARNEIDAIFNTVAAGVLVLDRERRILAFNNKLREIFLEGRHGAIGARCFEVICGSTEARMSECVFEKVLESGHGEHRTDISFQDRHYDVVGMPIGVAGGDISQVVLVYNDITEQKVREEALRHALEEAQDARGKLDGILRSVADPLLVFDRQGLVVLANDPAEKLLGIGPHGGQRAADGPEAGSLREQLQTVLALSPTPARMDLSVVSRGSERIYQAHFSPLLDLRQQAVGTIVLMHEVTGERDLERLKNEFVSTAAHELQTPLTAIIGFSDLLLNQEGLPAAIRQESLQLIQRKAEGLSLLVDDLLDLGRIESGRDIELHFEEQDIHQLLREVVRCCIAPRHQLDLQLSGPSVRLLIDGQRITQVMENLLSNAIKYSPAGGPIQVVGWREGDLYRISVVDQGIGMSAAQTKRIFEKFYRGDTSNTSIGGTGLGMSIARHLVHANHGRIWVESELGQGTSVHLSLPLTGR